MQTVFTANNVRLALTHDWENSCCTIDLILDDSKTDVRIGKMVLDLTTLTVSTLVCTKSITHAVKIELDKQVDKLMTVMNHAVKTVPGDLAFGYIQQLLFELVCAKKLCAEAWFNRLVY